MSIVYRTNDKIKIKVDSLVLTVSPLSYHDKNKIQSLLVTGNAESVMNGASLAIKIAVKGVSGLKLSDGSDYELAFEDGQLTNESLDDLMNIECNSKISTICLGLIHGIPKDFTNNNTGEVIEGIHIIKAGDSTKKK